MNLKERLAERKFGEVVCSRVLRLNPNPKDGEILRGLHLSSHNDPRWMIGAISKGEVIRRYGRTAWGNTPQHQIISRGKRKYVRSEYVRDVCEAA